MNFSADKKGAFSVVFPVIDDSKDCHKIFSGGGVCVPYFAMFNNA